MPIRTTRLFCLGLLAALAAAAQNPAQLEALQRLKGLDLEANPALRAAVLRVVEEARGTPQYVELVRDFQLAGQAEGLLEAAIKLAGQSAGAEAARLLLAQGEAGRLERALRTGHPHEAAPLAQSLGETGDRAAVPLLLAALGREDDHVIRTAAIRGLAGTQEGARELLRLAREGGLDERGRPAAALALAQARWPEIKAAAAEILPPPVAGDAGPLPPVEELVKLTGDPGRGARIFRSEQVACIRCHKVGDEGVDFGPALTEIGDKLDRRALYDSILEPNAGIAFGYEGWELETRQGEELFGIITSETADEVALKAPTGIVTRIRKADLTRREQQAASAMPAGLAEVMTRQELVDLIEYLTTLRRGSRHPPPAPLRSSTPSLQMPAGFEEERKLWLRGVTRIAGVDEAGRGPLAGPVVAAAVVLPAAWLRDGLPGGLRGLNDSKQLSAAAREDYFAALRGNPEVAAGVAVVGPEEIDRLNILRATHAAMVRALAQLDPPPAHVLVDGLPVAALRAPQTALVKGDARSVSIAAASVLAKVTRDRLMLEADARWPAYGFAVHKGYPTPAHLAALARHGPCPLHRRSFAPVRAAQRERFE